MSKTYYHALFLVTCLTTCQGLCSDAEGLREAPSIKQTPRPLPPRIFLDDGTPLDWTKSYQDLIKDVNSLRIPVVKVQAYEELLRLAQDRAKDVQDDQQRARHHLRTGYTLYCLGALRKSPEDKLADYLAAEVLYQGVLRDGQIVLNADNLANYGKILLKIAHLTEEKPKKLKYLADASKFFGDALAQCGPKEMGRKLMILKLGAKTKEEETTNLEDARKPQAYLDIASFWDRAAELCRNPEEKEEFRKKARTSEDQATQCTKANEREIIKLITKAQEIKKQTINLGEQLPKEITPFEKMVAYGFAYLAPNDKLETALKMIEEDTTLGGDFLATFSLYPVSHLPNEMRLLVLRSWCLLDMAELKRQFVEHGTGTEMEQEMALNAINQSIAHCKSGLELNYEMMIEDFCNLIDQSLALKAQLLTSPKEIALAYEEGARYLPDDHAKKIEFLVAAGEYHGTDSKLQTDPIKQLESTTKAAALYKEAISFFKQDDPRRAKFLMRVQVIEDDNKQGQEALDRINELLTEKSEGKPDA